MNRIEKIRIRRDRVTLHEFVHIMSKHLIYQVKRITMSHNSQEQREFAANMCELFREVDMNGDGVLREN